MKAPAFQFYVKDWLADTRCLSLRSRGAWIDILCHLHLAEKRGEDTHTIEEWAFILGTDKITTGAVLSELFSAQIAEVRFRKDDVRVMSRRMVRERKANETNALYQRRHRESGKSKEKVRLHSASASASAYNRERKTDSLSPSFEATANNERLVRLAFPAGATDAQRRTLLNAAMAAAAKGVSYPFMARTMLADTNGDGPWRAIDACPEKVRGILAMFNDSLKTRYHAVEELLKHPRDGPSKATFDALELDWTTWPEEHNGR